MTLESFVNLGKKRIEESGIQCADPMLHMKQILGASISLDSIQFYNRWQEPLTENEFQLANQLLERRLKGEPFQYLVCLLYTSPSPRDRTRSRMPSSA